MPTIEITEEAHPTWDARFKVPRTCPNFPPEVIEAVLLHLEVRHLKTCRLVCKSWNREACRVLRGKALLLVMAPDFDKFIRRCTKSCLDPLASLLADPNVPVKISIDSTFNDALLLSKTLANLRESPSFLDIPSSRQPFFPRVTRLNLFYAQPKKNQRSIGGRWLLSEFSSTLTHITVNCGRHYYLFSAWFPSTRDFPELEFMELNSDYDQNTECFEGQFGVGRPLAQQTKFMLTLHKILKATPKLRTLKARGVGRIEIPLFLENPINFSLLQHLEINSNSSLFEQILASNPTAILKTLILHFHGYNENRNHICTQLGTFAPNLEKLKFVNNGFFPKQCIFDLIPFFPKLTHLTLSSNEFFDDRLKSFRWLAKMPNLRFLRFNQLDLRRAPVVAQEGQQLGLLIPFPQLEVISVRRLDLHHTPGADDFIFFQNIFPHAKVLYQHMFLHNPHRIVRKSEISAPENVKKALSPTFVEQDPELFVGDSFAFSVDVEESDSRNRKQCNPIRCKRLIVFMFVCLWGLIAVGVLLLNFLHSPYSPVRSPPPHYISEFSLDGGRPRYFPTDHGDYWEKRFNFSVNIIPWLLKKQRGQQEENDDNSN